MALSGSRVRSPAWDTDELILALDVYVRVPRARNSKNDPALRSLSDTLRSLPLHPDRPDPERFRNLNAVYLKLQNFKAVDPEYTARGLTGMSAGAGRRERAIWERYADQPEELRQVAEAIRANVELPEQDVLRFADDESDETEAEEGRLLTTLHRRRERDPRLARKKKEQALSRQGTLVCEACGFDFAATYGDRGRGFIECHHRRPLSELRAHQRTRLHDLALVCSNCHSMIHRAKPWLSVEQVTLLLSGADR